MVSHYTLDLISWKILPKPCLIRYDTIEWWAELSNSCRIRPYLNTDPVVKLLTHYIGSCFKQLNLKVHLQHGVLNFKGGVSSKRSSCFDEAKVDPLHQPAGKDNSA